MSFTRTSSRLFIYGLIGLAAGLSSVFFLIQVTEWGHNIPSPNIATDYSVAFLWCVGLGLSVAIWPVSRADQRALIAQWVLRSAVTLGLMLFYENKYGLDAYTYYLEGRELTYDWDGVGFGKGTGNVGAIVWFCLNYLPVFHSYHSVKVIFSFIGFVAVYLAYRGIVRYSGRENPKLFLYGGCLPSLVFWSSILGKDPIVLFGICLYAWGVLSWLGSQKNLIYIAMAALGVIVAAWIRPWNGLILLVPLLGIGVFVINGVIMRVFYLAVISAGVRQTFDIFVGQFQLVSVDDLVRKTNIISKAWSLGGSAQVAPDFYNVSDMLWFAPLGMFTALFRPLPGEIVNLFGTLAGIENAALLFLLLVGFSRLSWKKLSDPAALWALLLLLTWSFVYSFVSYQNLGSAFRFRLQVLPVLLVFLLYLAQGKEAEIRKE